MTPDDPHCDNDAERVAMIDWTKPVITRDGRRAKIQIVVLWKTAAQRAYFSALSDYESLRRRHRKRSKAYARMKIALHALLLEEVRNGK